MREIEFIHSIIITGNYKHKIIYGCEVITHAMQNGAITKKRLANGFKVCGQHVPYKDDTDVRRSTISFDAIMAQSYNTISNEDLDNMRNSVPYFLNILRTCGEIKEIEYDSKNIPKLPDCDCDIRDGLVLWRQRAVVITNDETVLRFVNYETMRLLKLDK
jgi:hypothetical protein